MACTRNSALIKAELIRYISSLGIEVNTVTKARGNKGFFKVGRIDVSKNLDDYNAIRVLVHEFAHYINYNIDSSLNNLEVLFGYDNKKLRNELISVTELVDKHALCSKLTIERDKLSTEIKSLADNIKSEYPDFSLTSNFKEFRRYSRFSDIAYLEKYDRVKVNNMLSSKIYSISTLKQDFPDIKDEFVAYLTLKSKQRKRAKISRRINKLTKYYNEPCELFARFIEGMFIDIDMVKNIAPTAFEQFLSLYNKNHYKGLREVFSIIRLVI